MAANTTGDTPEQERPPGWSPGVVKGRAAEQEICSHLQKLARQFPNHFSFEAQPVIAVGTQNFVPDFRIEVAFPPFLISFYVECQRRNRIRRETGNKIDVIKGRTEHNLFFFVFDGPLAPGDRSAIEQSGTVCLSLAEFHRLLDQLPKTLAAVRAAYPDPIGLRRIGLFGEGD